MDSAPGRGDDGDPGTVTLDPARTDDTQAEPARAAPWRRELPRLPARYELIGLLGRGGMGLVVEARDLSLGRHVAIKVLSAVDDGGARAVRFAREARTVASLRHPGIVTVFDVDPDGAYMVMELVRGESLARRLRAGRLDAAELRRVATALLDGLAAAHGAGVVHRDVKPGNVLLGADGVVKLVDFGIAWHGDGLLTGDGPIGTPSYMAPEQMRGAPADPRADVYAAGATLFEAAVGRRLHGPDGRTGDVLGAVRSAIDDLALARVIARAVDEDPAARFADAAEMTAALRAPARRGRTRVIVAVAVAAMAVAGVMVARRPWRAPAAAASPPGPAIFAMLPFEDATHEPRLDYATFGLPHILTGELRRVEGLTLLDVHRLRGLAGADADPAGWLAEAASAGATFVVDGTVTGAEPAFVVRVRLRTIAGATVLTREVRVAAEDVPRAVRGFAAALAGAALGREVALAAPAAQAADAEAAVQRAIAALARHDLAAADPELAAALAIEPGNVQARYYRALLRWWLGATPGEVRGAISEVDVAALEPAQASFLVGLGLFIDHRYDDAVVHFAGAAERFGDDRDVLYGWFEALFHAGRCDEALAVYRRLGDLDPRFALAINHVLDYYAVRGDREGMRWAFERLDVDEATGHPEWLGWLALLEDRPADAVELLQGVLDRGRLRPEKAHDVVSVLVIALAVQGQLDYARAVVPVPARGGDTILAWGLAEAIGDGELIADAEAKARAEVLEQAPGWARGSLIVDAAIMMIAADRAIAELATVAARIREDVQPDRALDVSPSVVRAVLACRLGDAAELGAARASRRDEVRMVAAACDAEAAGAPADAARAWRLALASTADPRLAILELLERARVARAADDPAGVLEACGALLHPSHPAAVWGAAAPRCRAWTIDAALATGDVALAQATLTALAQTRRAADPLLLEARRRLGEARP